MTLVVFIGRAPLPLHQMAYGVQTYSNKAATLCLLFAWLTRGIQRTRLGSPHCDSTINQKTSNQRCSYSFLPSTLPATSHPKEIGRNRKTTFSSRVPNFYKTCSDNMESQTAYIKRSSETLYDVAGDVIRLLKQAGETVGVAESLTGGGVMSAITSVGGASAVFRGGVVSYATPLKERLLDVESALIAQHGVIHEDVARQMAIGARNATTINDEPTTWGIGTTGVAGPDSQDGKPVGMVFIGVASPSKTWALGPFHFPGDRHQVRQATIMEALSQLREILQARSGGVLA